jgi:hypothetical protein
MPLLHIAPVRELQVRGHTRLDLRQDAEQHRSPSLSWPSAHAAAQPIRGCRPALRRTQHQVDGRRCRDSITVIEHRLFDAKPRRLGRRMDQQARFGLVEGTPSMQPEARPPRNPS